MQGVVTQTGAVYHSKAVVITTGTFLRGEIILGELKYSSGPNNQQPSIKLSEHLQELGFDLVRFKTGTPPRVNSHTIDYSKTEIQPGDDVPRAFSYETTKYITDQLPCWLTYTNAETHTLIDNNLHRSPMYSGMIKELVRAIARPLKIRLSALTISRAIKFSLSLKAAILRKYMCRGFQQACLRMCSSRFSERSLDLKRCR